MRALTLPAAFTILALIIAYATPTDTSPRAAPYEIAEPIFVDDFDDEHVNEQLWTWSHTEAFSARPIGKRHYQVTELNGTLLIDAQVEHEGGWSAGQDVWVDSTTDLKGDHDVLIEIELSAQSNVGPLHVVLTGGEPPRTRGNPRASHLFDAMGYKQHPLNRENVAIRAIVSRHSELAFVQTGKATDDEMMLLI